MSAWLHFDQRPRCPLIAISGHSLVRRVPLGVLGANRTRIFILLHGASADLFLDTRICNGHTTASDSLWAGVPLITLKGAHFASRVASSLLTAIGLPELVTASLDEYEALALRLARNPAELAAIRRRLARTA